MRLEVCARCSGSGVITAWGCCLPDGSPDLEPGGACSTCDGTGQVEHDPAAEAWWRGRCEEREMARERWLKGQTDVERT